MQKSAILKAGKTFRLFLCLLPANKCYNSIKPGGMVYDLICYNNYYGPY